MTLDHRYATSEPKVSVLLTSYNHETYIDAAIQSVLDQTYPNFECIVIDDGSQDGSVARIQKYGSRIRFLQKDNGGQASAINLGVRIAGGSLVSFMDSDDLWERTKLEVVVQAATGASSPGLILHNFGQIDASGVRDRRPRLQTIWSGHLEHYMWTTGPWWPRPVTSGISIPKALLERMAPIPEEYFRISPDAYIVTLGAFLGPVFAVPDVLAYWRWHEYNATNVSVEERCERQLRFLHGINLGLRERLSITRQVSPEDVWWHQVTRFRSGSRRSPIRLSRLALGNPAQTPLGRLRDLVSIWWYHLRTKI